MLCSWKSALNEGLSECNYKVVAIGDWVTAEFDYTIVPSPDNYSEMQKPICALKTHWVHC